MRDPERYLPGYSVTFLIPHMQFNTEYPIEYAISAPILLCLIEWVALITLT